MADSEALRAALREAETAILDATKKIDPSASGDKKPAEDLPGRGRVPPRGLVEGMYATGGRENPS